MSNYDLQFNDDYTSDTKSDIEGFVIPDMHDGDTLRHRRTQLGLTQQQVADAAHILVRQYQRLESGERSMSGASLRIAMAICDVLRLDPHRFVPQRQLFS